MTEEQEIRAAAAMAVFGQAKQPIMTLSLTGRGGEMRLGSQDELRVVEAYIRDGLQDDAS